MKALGRSDNPDYWRKRMATEVEPETGADRQSVVFTPLERDALLGLVSMIVNDGLDTYEFSDREEAAIRRALSKLARSRSV